MQPIYRLFTIGLVSLACLSQLSCSKSGKTSATSQAASSTSLQSARPQTGGEPSMAPGDLSSVEKVVERAVAWHPRIIEASGRALQQQEAISEARSGYLPSIGGGLDLGLESGNQRRGSPRFNLTASQMVYDFGKVAGRVEAQSAVYDVRQAEYLTTVDEIIRDAVIASVEILRNGELDKVARDQIEDVRAIGKLVDARTDRGASTRSDKLQAEARVQAAESTALEIIAQTNRWQAALASIAGTRTAPAIGRTLPTAVGAACGAREPAWDGVPAVIAARSRLDEANARVKLARAEIYPTLALEATSQFDIIDADRDPDYVIGLRLRGDLYNGGSFRARQNAARLGAETATAGIASATYDAERTWLQSATQVRSLEALQKSLLSRQTMMRETRDLYQRQFLDLGTRTLLDVLNADQELHAARFDEINTRFDVYKLNLECAHAAGRLREMFGLTQPAGAQSRTGDAAALIPARSPSATEG